MKSFPAAKAVSMFLLTAVLACAQLHRREDTLRDQIVSQERAELDTLKTGDLKTFASLIAEDAVFVDAHGSAGKAEVVENTSNVRLHDYTMSDVKFVAISADSGVLVYSLTESGTSHGKEFNAKVNVSAVWAKRNDKWVCLFSQETAAR
jgi:ketosteroid isomerase-like protein